MKHPKPRARDLGIPFEGMPGAYNGLTDIPGVCVGHVSLIEGEGTLRVGEGPIRTGVTAILPRGRDSLEPCAAASYTLNGSAEMTGLIWVEESGLLTSPIMLTNTMSVGAVHEGVLQWGLMRWPNEGKPGLPVVGEAHDGDLNDMRGLHVRPHHAIEALEQATSGPVVEGNVGAGVGMGSHGFKSGIGTASRKLREIDGGFILAALVMANNASRTELRIAGVPVGVEIPDYLPSFNKVAVGLEASRSSIVIVIGTDAPLLPSQMKRVMRRAAMGLARGGSFAHNRSGDVFIGFSTAPYRQDDDGFEYWKALPNERMDGVFEATVQATEEAIVNALVASETLTGQNGHTYYGIPHERLQDVMRKYGRLVEG